MGLDLWHWLVPGRARGYRFSALALWLFPCRSGPVLGFRFGLGGTIPSRDPALIRDQDHRHVPAFERCVLLLRRYIFEVVEDTIEEVLADLGMGDLPAPEHDRHLHLVALAQQLLDGARLEVDVVHVDLRLHAHFTQSGLGLMLARLALLLRLLVLEAAEVHEAGDGGRGLAGDLDEVNVTLSGHGDCVCGW